MDERTRKVVWWIVAVGGGLAIALCAVGNISCFGDDSQFNPSPQTQLVPVATLAQHTVTIDTISDEAAKSVCRIRCSDGNTQGLGSGCYLGNGWVLTARHVVTGVPFSGITCEFPDGQIVTIHDLVTSRDCDSALIRLKWNPKDTPAQTIVVADVTDGDQYFFVGYDHGKNLRVYDGIANRIRYTTEEGFDHGNGTQRAIPGNSGGPIFNAHGEIVSNLHSHTSRNETLGVSNERLVSFISRVAERFPLFRNTLPSCRNGSCPPSQQPPSLNPPANPRPSPTPDPIVGPRGPAGPPGARGPAGPQGPKGTDGKDATAFSIDDISDEEIERLAKRLPEPECCKNEQPTPTPPSPPVVDDGGVKYFSITPRKG